VLLLLGMMWLQQLLELGLGLEQGQGLELELGLGLELELELLWEEMLQGCLPSWWVRN
jgi:hypothetical protein